MKQCVAHDIHRGMDEIAALEMDSARKIAHRTARGNDFAAFQFRQIDVPQLRKRA